jgi:CheY-like chemotaxis protein
MSPPRILIVDDDDMLRSSLARVLRGRFDVVVAENGAVALVIIEDSEKFDVILTDVEMPVMDGCVLVERLAEINPALADRVLVMTGGPRDAGLAAWVSQLASARMLAKPIETDKLLGAIEALLGGRV